MARHRHIRSLNASEEYENVFCESEDEDSQDSTDGIETSLSSAKRLNLSDFIATSCKTNSKRKEQTELPATPKRCATSVNLVSCEIYNDSKHGESYENDSSSAGNVLSSPIKRKLVFTPDIPKVLATDNSRFEKAKEFYITRNANRKPVINLAIIGHVDAGKSTIMGNMLVKLGSVSSDTIVKYRKESNQIGKSSYAYAWVFDETAEERKRGVTTDVSQRPLDTSSNSIIVLDTPGHKDFVSQMISGTSEADAAILVLDAALNGFEAGFHGNGQTKELIQLVKALGVSQLIVVINKMDEVSWKQERYSEIIAEITPFLKKVGYDHLRFVPCSGLYGINLIESPDNCDLNNWYNGITLLEAINELKAPERSIEKPFRLSVSDIFKATNKTSSVSGRIQSGYVKVRDQVIIMPEKHVCTISNVIVNDSPVNYGFVADSVELQLSGVDNSVLNLGSVICNLENPISVSSRLKARLVVFDTKMPITNGLSVVFQNNNFCEQAIIYKLISLLSVKTGETLKKRPRFLTKNNWADVEIHMTKPICSELYKDIKELGRFFLRCNNTSIAAGMILELLL